MPEPPQFPPKDHHAYMQHALTLARHAPALPTNFRVGALLVDENTNTILSTGYTMELPGNTHAEQCCLAKYLNNATASAFTDRVPHASSAARKLVLYTTMEPCNKRASGNRPCVETILGFRDFGDGEGQGGGEGGIGTVYVGVVEPERFVGANEGRARLWEGGVEYVVVGGLEGEILGVATAGHGV